MRIINFSDGYDVVNHNDKPHSYNDKPARVFKRKLIWCKNGLVHRDKDPAIIHYKGDITGNAIDYYLNNDKSKERYKEWYKNDKLHRVDGPAVKFSDNINNQYWIDGVRLSKEEFENYFIGNF